MGKDVMVENLVNYYTDGNKAQFAKMVGISPQTLSKWICRKTFDAELLYQKCSNLSADWLLSNGNGEMIRTRNAIISADRGGIAAGGNINSGTTMGDGARSTITNNYGETCNNGEPLPIVQTLTESVATLTRELETSQEQKSRLIGIIEKLTEK
ncbi:hypothetical protein ABVC73_04740 [Prevotella melaninogenica]